MQADHLPTQTQVANSMLLLQKLQATGARFDSAKALIDGFRSLAEQEITSIPKSDKSGMPSDPQPPIVPSRPSSAPATARGWSLPWHRGSVILRGSPNFDSGYKQKKAMVFT